eukprot:gb/GFBE01077603.1/.p1 GENE.gb/GFBE01077603.1/~~gb/GFBE01077603.1/.p1  ORF type:complete len:245 (+),score=45.27 gb/GFBE01077603.1/:1-735(+)
MNSLCRRYSSLGSVLQRASSLPGKQLLRQSHGRMEVPRRVFAGSRTVVMPVEAWHTQVVQVARRRCSEMVGVYRQWNKAMPFTMAFILYSSKAAGCDFAAQRLIERREKINVPRMLAAGLFGGCYAGCVQHWIFNVAFTKLFGSGTCWRTGAKKMLGDALVQTPLIYLPIFFAFDEFFNSGTVCGVLDRWCAQVVPTMTVYMKMWPAVHMYNFMCVPVELRMTTIAAASLVWLTAMSSVTHAEH